MGIPELLQTREGPAEIQISNQDSKRLCVLKGGYCEQKMLQFGESSKDNQYENFAGPCKRLVGPVLTINFSSLSANNKFLAGAGW